MEDEHQACLDNATIKPGWKGGTYTEWHVCEALLTDNF